MIINNMPAFYRTSAFSALVDEWQAKTGGTAEVAYQVRRDPTGRAEWFYTADDDIPFPHTFCSGETRRSRFRTGYPLHFGVDLFRRTRPTHVLAAGWDCPLTLTASAVARAGRTQLTVWVESNESTSAMTSPLATVFRRTVISPASSFVVPTPSSKRYVEAILKKSARTVEVLNPVSLQRLEGEEKPSGRLVFLGDLSVRKGFDHFLTACEEARARGWVGVAWGRPSDVPISTTVPCQIRPSMPLSEIVAELVPGDVLVIPSRTDPAPLVYSEGLALGLRTVVSSSIAYAEHADRTPGARSADTSNASSLLAAVEELAAGPRPTVETAKLVTSSHWARAICDGLLGGARAESS